MKLKPFPLAQSLVIILFLSTLPGCFKDRSSASPTPGQAFIHQAMQFFTDSIAGLTPPPQAAGQNPRLTCPRLPQWSVARTLATSAGLAVVVPIQYALPLQIRTNFSAKKLLDLGELTHLLMYKDSTNQFHAKVIIGFPDSVCLTSGQSAFTGILFVEDWSGNRLAQFKSAADGAVMTYNPTQSASGKRFDPNAAVQVSPDVLVTNCYEIDGYNYSSDDPDDSYSWSEPAGCNTMYLPDPINTVPTTGISTSVYLNAAGGLNVSPLTVTISGPTNPITNIQAYFQCFTNSTAIDHTYTITVGVSQPDPGTRAPWGFTPGGPSGSSAAGNPVNVGHAFLIFSENSAGSIITRNVGFYPAYRVNPVYPSDQGQLDDNENTDYDISLAYTVTNAQFFAIMNYVSLGNNPGYLYNLNSNNCTTFVLNGLAAGSINLPSTQGSWPGGSGYDPGDLGEDIRTMLLGPNMTRNTVENPHPNTGTCNN